MRHCMKRKESLITVLSSGYIACHTGDVFCCCSCVFVAVYVSVIARVDN